MVDRTAWVVVVGGGGGGVVVWWLSRGMLQRHVEYASDVVLQMDGWMDGWIFLQQHIICKPGLQNHDTHI